MNIYFIDLDGTIEDSKMDMSLSVNLVRKQLSLPELQLHFIEKHVNRGMDELYYNCFPEYLNNIPLIKETYEESYFNNVCIHTKVYDGIPEALEIMSQKGKIVVITNKPEKISRELLKKLDLIKYLTDIMGGDSCAECKPSPLPLIIAAKKLNIVSKNVYMIGDSEGDIKTAQAFGAKSVWCSWGYLKQNPILKPDFIVNSPKELIHL